MRFIRAVAGQPTDIAAMRGHGKCRSSVRVGPAPATHREQQWRTVKVEHGSAAGRESRMTNIAVSAEPAIGWAA
ncbi:hypothetical protein BZL30_4623 [Mycobacterium kansasii]|uniref:Uncharacterized protein n=1 Tax=Mycobacterium kansasii TaxID=1768 RepID=A0A1V3X3I3_MYCKA|nr:hypothetical protein BZL30_4623 [Mycobacterium kansasii]